MQSSLQKQHCEMCNQSWQYSKLTICKIMQYLFLIRSCAGCKKYGVFFTASARAYQKHILHGQETISIFLCHSARKLVGIILQFHTKPNPKMLQLQFPLYSGNYTTQQQVLHTRLCSTSRQNKTALPISRNDWKTSVLRSGYWIMSFSWAR